MLVDAFRPAVEAIVLVFDAFDLDVAALGSTVAASAIVVAASVLGAAAALARTAATAAASALACAGFLAFADASPVVFAAAHPSEYVVASGSGPSPAFGNLGISYNWKHDHKDLYEI